MKRIALMYWLCIAFLMSTLTIISSTMAQEPSEGLIAFTAERDGYMDIYTMTPDGDSVKRLTEEAGINHNAAWSPDGTQIAYSALRNNQYDLYIMDADGLNSRLVKSDDPNPKYDVTWSPDGTQIAYQSRPVIGQYGISILTIATAETRPLIMMEDIQGLEWSPDGTQIAFASPVRDQLDVYIIDVESNELTHLTESKDREGFPVWSRDGNHILVTSNDASLYIISRDGQDKRLLTIPPDLELKTIRNAIWSPDNTEIAFVGVNEDGESNIYLMTANGENIRQITTEGDIFGDLSWHPSPVFKPVEKATQIITTKGVIAFTAQEIRGMDIYTTTPDGNVAQRLTTDLNFKLGPVWSPDGTQIAYISSNDSDLTDIYIMDADGQNGRFVKTKDLNAKYNVTWSPDGTQIAYLSKNENEDTYLISIVNIGSGETSTVMEASGINSLIWSPNNRYFAFSRPENGQNDLFLFDLEENLEIKLTDDESLEVALDWSADGTKILFTVQTKDSNSNLSIDLYTMSIDGSNRNKLADDARWASWSPDDSQIAFIGTEGPVTGNIYVMDADGSSVRQITTEGNVIGRLSWQPVSVSSSGEQAN